MRFRKAPEGFSERLTEALFKSNLSPSEIERMTGINHTNISRYTTGEMIPGLWTLSCLCKLLNVSADWLLFGDKVLCKAKAYSMDGSGNLELMGETLTLPEIVEEVNQCNT